jgi:thiamine biosynthesis lipoprotein
MMQKIEFRAMGCQMMAALDNAGKRALQRLEQVPAWFEEWEQTLSRFRSDSELSQLNRSGGAPQIVSQTFWKVFQASLEAEKRSLGLVTPVVLEALEAAGYDRSFSEMAPDQPARRHVANQPARKLSAIRWDASSRTIQLPAGMRLDFGGIAKGWAAQLAAQRLSLYGPALVDAGGDIAISALMSDGQPWTVAIEDPFDPQSDIGLLLLGRGGVATSGKDYRRWKQSGIWKHHIIDPRSGLPAETDVLSATIVAPSVMEAEAAAKTVLILGSQAGLEWLEARPVLTGLIVLENGQRLNSRRFQQYLWSEPCL